MRNHQKKIPVTNEPNDMTRNKKICHRNGSKKYNSPIILLSKTPGTLKDFK